MDARHLARLPATADLRAALSDADAALLADLEHAAANAYVAAADVERATAELDDVLAKVRS